MPNTSQESLRQELLETMESLYTVDCHSHTVLRRDYYRMGPRDLFSLMAYFNRDIEGTAGRPLEALCREAKSDEERWRILKGVLERAGNVSYWRHNIVTYQRLFGLQEDDLTDSNWRTVNEAIRTRTADPNWYAHVTRDISRLETQVRNIPWFEDWEPEFFTAVLRMEPALELIHTKTRERLEQHLNRNLDNLAALKEGLATLVDSYRKRGAVGIKLAHAYRRTLASEPVEASEADRTFAKALKGEPLTSAEVKAFEDHLIYFLADLCTDLNIVFQIHTGVQTNWGHIPDSDPLLLIPLIRSHRSTRFDLFHAGYPYSREIGMLGKHFPNVWLNMAWMYVITMEGSRQTLREWIDLVPAERLLGFGSDVHWPEMVYAHLVMARSCLADVLAEKVRRDFLSKNWAFRLAQMMLRDNALRLYGLTG